MPQNNNLMKVKNDADKQKKSRTRQSGYERDEKNKPTRFASRCILLQKIFQQKSVTEACP
jgi:hypothetical protein